MNIILMSFLENLQLVNYKATISINKHMQYFGFLNIYNRRTIDSDNIDEINEDPNLIGVDEDMESLEINYF